MLFNSTDLLVFLTAALSLNLTPGNDMMYVLGQSLKGGARSGISASLGIAGGSLIHLGFVALGVAVILAQLPRSSISSAGLLPCLDRLHHAHRTDVGTCPR
jgi:threonine/homoserine/homoserine lactone efflux protein